MNSLTRAYIATRFSPLGAPTLTKSCIQASSSGPAISSQRCISQSPKSYSSKRASSVCGASQNRSASRVQRCNGTGIDRAERTLQLVAQALQFAVETVGELDLALSVAVSVLDIEPGMPNYSEVHGPSIAR